jgi:FkbM family methyltransferase
LQATHEPSLEKQLSDLLSEPVEEARERSRRAFDKEVEGFKNRFVLFGAGNMGRRVLARLRQDGIEPLAFSDNQNGQWGKTINGLDVLAPRDAITRFSSDAVFIVTIYNNNHSFLHTRSQLLNLGCEKVISVIPLRWKYWESFLPYFRDDLPHKVLVEADAIRGAFGLWNDEPSRREFVGQVSWRLHGDFAVLGTPDADQEYFPEDLFRFTGDDLIVDVGAFDGDTIRRFLKLRGNEFRGIVALEPDPGNFGRLTRYVSGLPVDVARKIDIHALAAANHAGKLRFAAGEGVASALSKTGSIEVSCVRLDELLADSHPTYIKMDVEGAEPDAIEGCKRILADERPILAACVYHAQDHLWNIPIALSQITRRHYLFLRPHMPECWDTVCYAVPHERAISIEGSSVKP